VRVLIFTTAVRILKPFVFSAKKFVHLIKSGGFFLSVIYYGKGFLDVACLKETPDIKAPHPLRRLRSL
jgi:hypothetical protein